ncbi:hypothetical protein CFOL_v3_26778, partial [Cephalotus follicularis]
NPLDIAKRVFHPDCHYYNNYAKKTQTYYEFILVDTDSIKISPKFDPNNPGIITHTSVFIQKNLTISKWGQNSITINNLQHHLIFLFQNIEDRNSWSFCFDKTFNTKQTIPYWFVDWWRVYGPIEEILPSSVEEALDIFTKHTEPITLCPTMQSFFIHCKLSWIMYWIMSLRNPLEWCDTRDFKFNVYCINHE